MSTPKRGGEREVSHPISSIPDRRDSPVPSSPMRSDFLPSRGPDAAVATFLRSAAHLPYASGTDALARTVCDLVKAMRPDLAVGVVLSIDGGPAVQITAERFSDAPPSTGASNPPPSGEMLARIFPTLDDEWIVALPTPFEGSALHVAGTFDRDDDSLAVLVERAAILLVSSLAATRALASSSEPMHASALQARIIQSEKLASVGQIAAKVVHELNNPLTAIVSYSDYLIKRLERAGHDPADLERLHRIGESAARILRFSRDLTTYARPNESVEPVALSEVLDRAVVFCEHVAIEHHVRVQTRFDPEAPSIEGRRGQLTQVFVNLITNAVHAIEEAQRGEDAQIEIETSVVEQTGGIRIVIADNGKGIPPENVVRIFDPFFTTKAAGRGTGLGLSIVRSIVEEHGGRVWVRSILGQGTQFVVELPARPRPV